MKYQRESYALESIAKKIERYPKSYRQTLTVILLMLITFQIFKPIEPSYISSKLNTIEGNLELKKQGEKLSLRVGTYLFQCEGCHFTFDFIKNLPVQAKYYEQPEFLWFGYKTEVLYELSQNGFVLISKEQLQDIHKNQSIRDSDLFIVLACIFGLSAIFYVVCRDI